MFLKCCLHDLCVMIVVNSAPRNSKEIFICPWKEILPSYQVHLHVVAISVICTAIAWKCKYFPGEWLFCFLCTAWWIDTFIIVNYLSPRDFSLKHLTSQHFRCCFLAIFPCSHTHMYTHTHQHTHAPTHSHTQMHIHAYNCACDCMAWGLGF